jgi:hypothetical protein
MFHGESNLSWATRQRDKARHDALAYRTRVVAKYGRADALLKDDRRVARWESVVAALSSLEGK